MRPVIINADDYAMDEGVDAAILQLAGEGAVTSASAMVLSPRWPEAARAARDAPLSLGLHLDLTSPFAGDSAPAQRLSSLMARAQARLLDPAALRRNIERQVTLFESHSGAAPDFADGHQHVHHLPVVRDVLMDVLQARYGAEAARVGLRICASRRWRGVKAAVIAETGARGLAQLATAGGHPRNSDFAGVYDFAPRADLPALWENWAARLQGPLPLIMCHVATRGAGDGDPIREARHREYGWLASDAFKALRTRLGIRPARWPRV